MIHAQEKPVVKQVVQKIKLKLKKRAHDKKAVHLDSSRRKYDNTRHFYMLNTQKRNS